MSDENPSKPSWSADPPSHDAARSPAEDTVDLNEHVAQIGRYYVLRVLGEGGFGRVYLARDEQLERDVAIKVPHRDRITEANDVEAFLHEARMLAALDHPHIVPVYDVGSSDEYPCYVVSKFVEGTDLARRMHQHRLTHRVAAELVKVVAEALHYAHKRGLVHRDVKPGNILVAKDGTPCVADFGLAVRSLDPGSPSRMAGTPSYMSPEQARGEGHRVDGRSDIFSLGIVFYELLTGERPFRGSTVSEVLDQLKTAEVRPLRQVDDTIPKELERICLKALRKRASERYTTAHDMAEDLQTFLDSTREVATGPATTVRPAANATQSESARASAAPTPAATPANPESSGHLPSIVPKGLRAFDAVDAAFFLELLPGPRDRDGLPDSIRFWKNLIEETDPDATFPVGLLYGPSGCGKSSLVRAGLLPRLDESVVPVYVEATADDTERRLRTRLARQFAGLSPDARLPESLAWLRRGAPAAPSDKTLIVIDQFEQWLHATDDYADAELTLALRQCDGQRVQCLLLVRDEFWLAVSRFMQELEVRLVEGHNSGLVDLFDLDHAERTLRAFGRAFGRLPESSREETPAQKQFLRQAVSGLAVEDKVICVRLALFAEMMKGRPWEPSRLRDAGGASRVGVTFLEETFSAKHAPPAHRLHQRAARGVLRALLPDAGSELRGHMQPRDRLLEASGYARREHDFDVLLDILDRELRLITPTDPEGSVLDDEPDDSPRDGRKYYQLTHDFLVPAVREWLTRKQRETRQGRAELRLAERAAIWSSRPENRHLPSLWEYGNILLRTSRQSWTAAQREMMTRATRYYVRRGFSKFALALALSIIGWQIGVGTARRVAETRFDAQIDRLAVADMDEVPQILAELGSLSSTSRSKLIEAWRAAPRGSSERLRLGLALPSNTPGVAEDLTTFLLDADPDEVAVIRNRLWGHRDAVTEPLWSVVTDDKEPSRRVNAAAALAAFAPDDPRWSDNARTISRKLLATLRANPGQISHVLEVLAPASEPLVEPLGDIARDTEASGGDRNMAAVVYAEFAKDDRRRLVELLQDAEPEQFVVLFRKLDKHRESVIEDLEQRLAKSVAESSVDRPAMHPSASPPVPPDVRVMLEQANGFVGERIVSCETLPLADLDRAIVLLDVGGYRPVRLRPYQRDQALVAAAVWIRDSVPWKYHAALTATEFQQLDEQYRREGFVPQELAGYLAGDGTADDGIRYAATWREASPWQMDVQVCLGVDADEYDQVRGDWEQQDYDVGSKATFRDRKRQTRYCSVAVKWSPDTMAHGNRVARRQANLALALFRCGKPSVARQVLVRSIDPTARAYAIERFAVTEVPIQMLVEQLDQESDNAVRFALLLALGSYPAEQFDAAVREHLVSRLTTIYRSEADAGLRGAAGWLLRILGAGERVVEIDTSLQNPSVALRGPAVPSWYVNSERQTMVVLTPDGPFMMGSHAAEPNHSPDEIRHFRVIDRRFAICATEVTVEQFVHFLRDHPEFLEHHSKPELVQQRKLHAPDPQGPQINVTWYQAAAYCNWLSKREGLPPEQWCYEPNADGQYAEGMRAAPDFLHRTGYRLPTESEWEYAARCGTESARFFGQPAELLPGYAYFDENSQDRAWPVGNLKPNDNGLFDMLGNVTEWCQDRYTKFSRTATMLHDEIVPEPASDRVDHVVRGGALHNHAQYIGSAERFFTGPSNRSIHLGFRVARSHPR